MKTNVKTFLDIWRETDGNEMQETQQFWTDFARFVLGVNNTTAYMDFERKVRGRRIDVFVEEFGVLIEQKSKGIDLDKPEERGKTATGQKRFVTPYEQAWDYAKTLPASIAPRWIITCNFEEFRIYDLDKDEPEKTYETIEFKDLEREAHRFRFMIDKSNSRIEKEKELSVEAGKIVGKLYTLLASQYKNIEDDPQEQRSLNILIVRIVFCLYAEDAELFHERDAFLNYLKSFQADQFRMALINLFKVLNTPDGEHGTIDERDPYLNENVRSFPYVNGGLFNDEEIIIPQFTENIRIELLLNASQKFNWSGISPTIFGSVFESTLNPETRRSGGMHYTSIENIHKVIDPLFLDDLKEELQKIEALKTKRDRDIRLKNFQKKLSSQNIFDPACGSGNFLTESYLSLRKLENRVIENLQGEQKAMDFQTEGAKIIQVAISQFYGIEINDFAVSVAKTALWIAEAQMLHDTEDIIESVIEFFPLTSNSHIIEGNALRLDWEEVLPARNCDYICGNPPFIGYKEKSNEQKNDLECACVGLNDEPIKGTKSLDYVVGWYYRAALYMKSNNDIKAAFVSTNSITQGEQVILAWKPLFEEYGIHFNFAYPTFVWNSEVPDSANVYVVIIGFSYSEGNPKLWLGDSWQRVKSINPYLVDAPIFWIGSRRKPICNVKDIKLGVHLLDNHEFIFNQEEMEIFIKKEPSSKRYFRKWVSANDFLYDKTRWFLDLENCPLSELDSMPLSRERVQNVIQYRKTNKSAQGTALEHSPFKVKQGWKADKDYLAIPNTSSVNRTYLPMKFLKDDTVITMPDLALPDATLYYFGILSSKLHFDWAKAVSGKLKGDVRYATGIVYNNFPWPNPTSEQISFIEEKAQFVLDTREYYPNKSLADLYNPDKMPEDLLRAHEALDKAVEAAYGVSFNGDEEKTVAHLFKLYAEITGDDNA